MVQLGWMNSQNFGQPLIIFGVVLTVVGFLILTGDKIPLLGKLPGDIYIDRGNFKFYFPLTTSLLISIVITLFANIFRK